MRKWIAIVEPVKRSFFGDAISYHNGQILSFYDAYHWLEYEILLPDEARSLLMSGTGAKLELPKSYTSVGLGLIGHEAYCRLEERVKRSPSLKAKLKARVDYFQQAAAMWDRRSRLAVSRNEAISTFDAFRVEKNVDYREKEIAIKFYVSLALDK